MRQWGLHCLQCLLLPLVLCVGFEAVTATVEAERMQSGESQLMLVFLQALERLAAPRQRLGKILSRLLSGLRVDVHQVREREVF